MNTRYMILFGGLAIIWIVCCALIGFDILGVLMSVLISVFYVAIVLGVNAGIVNAKKDLYLAHKYDEEKNKKVN